ncbi:MAG: hypothetical protein AB7V77_03010 [Candidatus Woesearchaeota archaeon]
MAGTILGEAVTFFGDLGIYDVVLPFLLVFTLIFAFLEKTKILGVEIIRDSAGKEHSFSRKNLNSMIAFTVAFFVIASSQIVRIISDLMANVVILIVLGLSYMLAVGIFHTGPEEFEVKGWQKTIFSIVSLIGVFLILFNSLGWLDKIYNFVLSAWYKANIAAFILVIVFVGFIVWITWSPNPETPVKKEEKGD